MTVDGFPEPFLDGDALSSLRWRRERFDTKNIPRAVLKQPKVYFSDNALAQEGARFENLVATSLLKRINFLEDRDGYRYELRYIRDKEGREVDFAILKEGKIEELVEVKYSDDNVSKSLLYYARRLNPRKATQPVAQLKRSYDKAGVHVTDPISYFRPEIYGKS